MKRFQRKERRERKKDEREKPLKNKSLNIYKEKVKTKGRQ